MNARERLGRLVLALGALVPITTPLAAAQVGAPIAARSAWDVERNADGSVDLTPRGARRASERVLSETELVALATERMRDSCGVLGVDPETLAVERVSMLPLGLVGTTDKLAVRWKQTFAGVAVEGAASALLDMRGRVLAVSAAVATRAELAMPALAIDAAVARRTALAELVARGRSDASVVAEPALVFARDAEHPERGRTLAWTTVVRSPASDGAEETVLEVRVDAERGAVLQVIDRVLRFDVTGRVAAWVTPGILPDDLAHPAVAQSACTPCSTATCGACPPISCAAAAASLDPSTEVPAVMADMELSDEHGNVVFSDADGSFRFPGSAPLTVTARFRGRHADVTNENGASYVLSTTLVNDAGNRVLLGGPAPYTGGPTLTAQANAYSWTTRVRHWIADVNPTDATWENEPYGLKLRVNLAQTVAGCDAEFRAAGTSSAAPEAWFCIGGGPCGVFPVTEVGCGCCGTFDGVCTNKSNATVILHELGHWMNDLYFDVTAPGAFNEGVADCWATYVTRQAQVFPYFCGTGTCGRSGENCRAFTTYADQFVGDGHKKGEVILGALWQVRARLVATRGEQAGSAIADALFFDWMLTYPEFAIHGGIKRRWVLLDDDDANPSTPSPHQAEILGGFESHGL